MSALNNLLTLVADFYVEALDVEDHIQYELEDGALSTRLAYRWFKKIVNQILK